MYNKSYINIKQLKKNNIGNTSNDISGDNGDAVEDTANDMIACHTDKDLCILAKFQTYNYGTTINIDKYITDVFTEIFSVIDTNNVNSHFIDEDDNFKIKDKYLNVITDGIYKIKTSYKIMKVDNWTDDNKYMVLVKNGIVKNICSQGIYLDPKNGAVQEVNERGECFDVINGIYYNNPLSLFNISNGIITNLSDGYYDLSNGVVINITNGYIELYAGHYLNIRTNKHYDNQKLKGSCSPGMTFLCDNILLIKTNANWKKIYLSDL